MFFVVKIFHLFRAVILGSWKLSETQLLLASAKTRKWEEGMRRTFHSLDPHWLQNPALVTKYILGRIARSKQMLSS